MLGDELAVLAAMSIVDGCVCVPETRKILEYVRERCLEVDIEWTDEISSKLWRYIRRLRPENDTILSSLDHISNLPVGKQVKFVCACSEVMHADGLIHEAEESLFDEIRTELLGC